MATVVELKSIARDLALKGYSKMRKAELESVIALAMDMLHSEAIEMDSEAVIASVALPRVSGKPMDAATREAHYKAANGCDKLTSRQTRRLVKKAFKAYARNTLAA